MRGLMLTALDVPQVIKPSLTPRPNDRASSFPDALSFFAGLIGFLYLAGMGLGFFVFQLK